MIRRVSAVLALIGALALVAAAEAAPRFPGFGRPAQPAAGPPPAATDWRTPDPENVLVIDTNKGRIIAELTPALAPNHVARIKELTRQGFYNGRTFFRVIDGFMAQTGDPLETGEGGSTLPTLGPEFSIRRDVSFGLQVLDKTNGKDNGYIGAMPVISQPTELAMLMADGKVPLWGAFCPGVLGMARADAPDSANSQFFLMRATNHGLEQNYTAFGRVLIGLDVVRAIKTGEPVAPPRDTMTTVRVLADIPEAERPKVRVINTASAWFKAEVERRRRAQPAGFSLCDVPLPAEVQ